jgi:phage shock protein E
MNKLTVSTALFFLFFLPVFAQAQVVQIDEAQLLNHLEKKDIVLLDVRTPEEVNSGYIKGTAHFININDSDFTSKINALDKSKTYAVYCRSGARSNRAALQMSQAGFKQVKNLQGGIMSWKSAEYIVRK